jgi:hypothetical protein
VPLNTKTVLRFMPTVCCYCCCYIIMIIMIIIIIIICILCTDSKYKILHTARKEIALRPQAKPKRRVPRWARNTKLMPTAKHSLCLTGHKKAIFSICDLPEDGVGARNTVPFRTLSFQPREQIKSKQTALTKTAVYWRIYYLLLGKYICLQNGTHQQRHYLIPNFRYYAP